MGKFDEIRIHSYNYHFGWLFLTFGSNLVQSHGHA